MPNAPEAEQAVIGSLLSFGGDKVFDAISPELNKDMFYDNRYAVLYNAIQSLYSNNKPCDIVSVSNEIRSMGKIDEVPLHFIAETSNYGYDSFHVVEHALMVKQKYLQRKAIELSHILQQQAYDDTEDIGDVLFNAGKALEQMQQDLIGQSESQSFKDIAQSALKNIERKMGMYSSGQQTGITTGYKSGADAYIPKPFDLDSLKIVIGNILKNREKIHNQYISINQSTSLQTLTNSKADEDFMTKINIIIHENLSDEEFSVQQLADLMTISRSSLYNKIKIITGLGVNDYINRLRIEKAISLLTNTNLNINEISSEVGFTYPRYFSSTFKQMKGMTPKQFREENRMK